jgi:hypothetical protein
MAAKTEGFHTGEFLLGPGPGNESRDNATVTVQDDTTLAPGTVLGKVSGKYVPFDQDASDGSETAAGILYDALTNDGVAPADYAGVVIDYACEVRGADLTWPSDIEAGEKTTAIADLLALGIKVR